MTAKSNVMLAKLKLMTTLLNSSMILNKKNHAVQIGKPQLLMLPNYFSFFHLFLFCNLNSFNERKRFLQHARVRASVVTQWLKSPPCMCWNAIQAIVLLLATPLPVQLPVNGLGKQGKMTQNLVLLCPCGRPEESSDILNSGCVSHLRNLSLTVSHSLSV